MSSKLPPTRNLSPLPCPPPLTLPARAADSHKGTYGRCLLIGGSPGLAGAISLSGQAALRSGAGLVTVATHAECRDLVASFEPCYMTQALPASECQESLSSYLSQISVYDAVGCGPGLGDQPIVKALVARLYCELPVPLVLDADALNALSKLAALPESPAGPRVFTPHPGEFRRLMHLAPDTPVRALQDHARDFAAAHRSVLVLKGNHTLVTDGQQHYENQTGNPGMATGGTGDVLTGIITALLGQGLAPFQAAQLGVYLHGLAGDIAAMEWGETSLIASDLLVVLPQAFRRVAAYRP